MTGSLQNRLQNYEVVPPASVWNSISERLDDEYSSADASVSDRLQNLFVSPPPVAWNNISAALDEVSKSPAKGRVVSLVAWRTAAAAVIVILLLAGSIYFLNNDPSLQQLSTTSGSSNNNPPQQKQQPLSPAATENPEADPSSDVAQREAEKRLAAAERPRPQARVKRIVPPAAEVVQPNYSTPEHNYADNDVVFEASQSIPQTVMASHNISVSAPPIRDGNGEIIMDLDIIREPGEQYITVTSPNGDQTRISNKFINCLRYLNGSLSVGDSHPDALECRNKFNEWRNRLLVDGEFMPSGDNFFDIFQLKELIQE